MAAIQLSFSLRTSEKCKTVHLLGNWDGYKGQLPLSKDSSKSGSWRGTFRFQGATLKQGQRYWYYYIIDGYHVSHDPAQPHTVEPTTKRKLNILDIPAGSSSSRAAAPASRDVRRDSKRHSASIPHGRSLSPSKIIAPRPTKPHEARRLANGRYSRTDVDALTRSMGRTQLSASSFSDESDDTDSDSEIDSDGSSDIPSLSSSRSGSSINSPVSPTGSACSCDRWGVTRKGDRVRLDCGGSRCGSELSDSSSDDEHAYRSKLAARQGEARRHGIVVRHSRR